jgi:DNA-binding NtrC family response regulator
MLRVAVRCGNHVRHFPLPERPVVLGSSADSDWVCRFPGISRRHARVEPNGGHTVRLVDLDSKNGLKVEGRLRSRIELHPGVLVHLGHAVLELEEVSSDEGVAALVLQDDASSSGHLDDDTSPGLEADQLDSPFAALRLARELEAREPWALIEDQDLADTARVTLDARSLVVLAAAVHHEPTIARCSGPLPSQALLDEVAALSAREEDSLGEHLHEGALWLVGNAGRGPGLLCGFDDISIPAWKKDFADYLLRRLRSRYTGRRREAAEPPPSRPLCIPPGTVLGQAPATRDLLQQIESTVSSHLDVLLLGETGTGKEVFAQILHASGPTAGKPFLPVNCAAIPAELLEAQLFGVESGVATGVDRRAGLFVDAGAGTLMLDEVGELALPLQAKLLRVLQEREVLPVGGSRPKKIEARVISASNRDLAVLVQEGRFRADLYYRLRRLEFTIPPLRERRDDIPALVLELTRRAARRYHKRITGVSQRALVMLVEYPWPGNVRELETAVEKAVLACPSGGSLESRCFGDLVSWRARVREIGSGPEPVLQGGATAPESSMADAKPSPGTDQRTLAEEVIDVERRAVAEALSKTSGNKSKAAALLGITRQGLNLKLRRWRGPG